MDMRPGEQTCFVDDEAGVTLMEYALVCFFIAVTCILIVTAVGANTGALFTTICQAVANAVSGSAGC